MRHSVLVVGLLATVGGPAGQPAGLPVAPAPRVVDDTRVYRGWFKQVAWPPDQITEEAHTTNGVEWRVNLKVRRLVSSRKDVLDFHWRIKGVGARQPLVIQVPSLDTGFPDATAVSVYAFPRGNERGRFIRFATPPHEGGFEAFVFRGPPKDWYMTVEKGGTETGTVTLAVADIKAELLRRWGDEFAADAPPDLYAWLEHKPEDRGQWHDLDAWTGWLMSEYIEVPAIKAW